MLSYRELTLGVDGWDMALDLLSRVFQHAFILVFTISYSILVEFPMAAQACAKGSDKINVVDQA